MLAKPGLGLGLAIVRGIIEAHGGTIKVGSQVSCATTFMLGLPLECMPGMKTGA